MLGQMSGRGRTAEVGMLQSFVCVTGNGSEEVLTCTVYMLHFTMADVGKWLSGHYCK